MPSGGTGEQLVSTFEESMQSCARIKKLTMTQPKISPKLENGWKISNEAAGTWRPDNENESHEAGLNDKTENAA